jgi:hypothetical protein
MHPLKDSTMEDDSNNNEGRSFTTVDTVAEFQRRRRLATKRGGPFLVLTVLCVVAEVLLFNLNIDSPTLKLNLFFIFLIGGFASWGVHLYFEAKYGRCPNCEHIPMSRLGRVDIDPVVCPRCGARLREYGSIFK